MNNRKFKTQVVHPENFEVSNVETDFPEILVKELEKVINQLPFITTPAVLHPDDPHIIKFGIADENDRSEKGTMQKYTVELTMNNREEDPNEK